MKESQTFTSMADLMLMTVLLQHLSFLSIVKQFFLERQMHLEPFQEKEQTISIIFGEMIEMIDQ